MDRFHIQKDQKYTLKRLRIVHLKMQLGGGSVNAARWEKKSFALDSGKKQKRFENVDVVLLL